MTDIMTFALAEVMPHRDAVLANQGIASDTVVSPDVDTLYRRAIDVLAQVAAPAGLLREMAKDDFRNVYAGEGRNEPATPVADVTERADHLALFVVTLGGRVSREIERLLLSNDFPLASMLDSSASAAADQAAARAERRFEQMLRSRGCAMKSLGVLRYSPGYCGWDISGQKKLFEFLRPERIGVTLRDSFLMEPLKSVSGVIIAGSKDVHDVSDSYSFCERCETHGCRERIRALRRADPHTPLPLGERVG